nr:hypothetical protein [Methanosarcina sp. WWM596]
MSKEAGVTTGTLFN